MRKTDRKPVPLPKKGEWFSVPYTTLLLSRMAAPTLLLLAVLIIAGPVVLLIACTSASDLSPVATQFKNTVGSLRTVLPIICAFIGVIIGASVQKEMLSPRSASFLHALPYRRECHLLCRYAVGWLSALIGLAGSFLLSVLVTLLFGLGGSLGMLLAILPRCLLCFLAFYTLSFLCGTLAGRSFVQVLLTIIIAFLPIALYELHLLWISQCTPELYMSFYESEMINIRVFPFCRLLTLLTAGELGAAAYIGWIVGSAVMLALSLFFGRLRDDTRCGDPMVFRPAETVLLYLAVLFAAQIARIIFSNIASFSIVLLQGVWTVFGILAISLLTFLVCGAFLRGSWREALRRSGGWCVFAVLFLITTALIAFNVFSPLGILSDPARLTEATIIHANEQYTYSDPAELEAFCAIVRESREDDYGSITTTLYDIGDDTQIGVSSGRYTVYVTCRTRLGFAFGRILNLSSRESVADALRTLADSPETEKAVNDLLDMEGMYVHYMNNALLEDDLKDPIIPDGSLRTDPVNAAYFDRTFLGTVYLYSTEWRRSTEKALFCGDPLTDALSSGNLLSEETLGDFCEKIDRVLVIDTQTGKTAAFDTDAELREILLSLASFSTEDAPLFTIPDERYVVIIETGLFPAGSQQTAFRSGHIPACVTAQFGS